MTTQETARVLVELVFTTEQGEIPNDLSLKRLIDDQMEGILDDETGLRCLVTEITARTGELDGDPVALAWGNPFDGLRFVGPAFPNDGLLEEATDVHLRDDYWWYVPLVPLSKFLDQNRRLAKIDGWARPVPDCGDPGPDCDEHQGACD
jgi:hypothetical protein